MTPSLISLNPAILMFFFGKPYPMYSRICPPFCFNILHPDIQVRQILHPEKTRLKGTLLTVRLSLALMKGQAGEGSSSLSILAFTLLLLVSLIFIFILLLKRHRIIVVSPIRNLLYSFRRAASRDQGIHSAIMQTPPKKKK